MFFRVLAILLLAAGLAAESGAASVRTVTAAGRSYANLYDVSMRHNMRFARTKTARVLSSRTDRMTIYQEKRYMFLNGVRISQCFSPILRAGTLYVSSLDLNKTIDPLLGSRKGFRHSIRTIMLDIGHGGKDRGAAGRSSLEKDITLRLGRRLAAVLRACGYRVILTRNSDIYLDLDKRSALQRKYGADLFLSLHINSAADRSVSGIETFCLTPPRSSLQQWREGDLDEIQRQRFRSQQHCSGLQCPAFTAGADRCDRPRSQAGALCRAARHPLPGGADRGGIPVEPAGGTESEQRLLH